MIRKNSKFGGFAPTAKTPKSEGLRTLKNIISKYLILQNRSFHMIRKNSKFGGFAHSAKTPKSEGLRTLKNIISKYLILQNRSSQYNTQKLQIRRVCAHRKNSKIGGFAYSFGLHN